MSSSAAPLAYAAGLPRRWLVAGLAALVLVAAVVELTRRRSAWVREHFTRYTGPLLRPHEHVRVSGATWMLVAYLFAAVAYPPAVAVAAMWAVGVGDASAAVVGRWWGERRRARGAPTAGKTYAGTLACAVAAFAGAWLVAALPLAAAVAAGVAAAAAERPRGPLDDNLRIVAAVGAAVLAWRTLAG